MKWPMVSVVIPAYNAGKWIHWCLSSCIHQILPRQPKAEPISLYPGMEIIVADDGSTDDTVAKIEWAVKNRAEVLEKAKGNRRIEGEGAVVVTIRMAHKGYAAAFNAALAAARGEVIARLDADDLISLGRTARCVQALCGHCVEAEKGRVDIVSSEMFLVDGSGCAAGETHVGGMVEEEYVKGAKAHGPCTATLVAWRRVYEKVGPFSTDPRWEWSPDSEWDFRALRARVRWAHIPEPLYFYRMHPDRMTMRGGGKGHQAYLEQIEEHLKAKGRAE